LLDIFPVTKITYTDGVGDIFGKTVCQQIPFDLYDGCLLFNDDFAD